MTIDEAYKECLGILKNAGIADAETDTDLLLEYVCKISRGYRLGHGCEELMLSCTDDIEVRFMDAVNKRAKRIPLQHITGKQEFMGLTFRVNPSVLIPRFDTETLVEETLKHVHDGMKILDMCTGSGCILISLLNYSNGCIGVGADISEEALEVARENADRLLKDKDDINISYVNSNIFSAFKEGEDLFDIIVSNPPYIKSAVIDTLETEVKDYDPRIALDGGEDGLYFYKEIISKAPKFLKGSGVLALEIGYDEGDEVSSLMKENHFTEVNIIKDLSGNDRVVTGIRKCLIS